MIFNNPLFGLIRLYTLFIIRGFGGGGTADQVIIGAEGVGEAEEETAVLEAAFHFGSVKIQILSCTCYYF